MSITYKSKPQTHEELSELLCEPVKKWFFQKFESFSLPQLYGVMNVHSRINTLISAPTGATKTLTSFLAILNELVDSAQKGILEQKTYAIYVSPLKALNKDIHVNLIEPLQEIAKLCPQAKKITVGLRTGDTTPYERQKLNKNPPHILITTPESLALLLNSTFVQHITGIEWFIIDEIHALASSKRGTQLALLLEYLAYLQGEFCRIGLSATIEPLNDVASFLVGKRDCQIIDLKEFKNVSLTVNTPVTDFLTCSYDQITKGTFTLIHEYIQSHKSVLVFTNTRSATEKFVFELKSLYPNQYYEIQEEPPFARSALIGAHHGSLSKEHRETMEQKLREGKLKCVICSSSLELGIDIGYIDVVLQVGSPKSVARIMQRIGRSGHKLHSQSKGILIPQDMDDCIECEAICELVKIKKIDAVTIPNQPLDVLSQFILGICVQHPTSLSKIHEIVSSSYPYRNITQQLVYDICDMHTHSNEERRIYAKLEIKNDVVSARSKTLKRLYAQNAGTIADSGGITVKIGNRVLGFVDEEFADMLKPGDIFVIAGDSYAFKFSKGLTIQVNEAHKRAPTVPRWRSQALSLPYDIAQFIKEKRDSFLLCEKYVTLQHKYLKNAQIEVYEQGNEVYHIIHTMTGRNVNAGLSLLLTYAGSKLYRHTIKSIIHENGVCLIAKKEISIQYIVQKILKDDFDAVLQTAIINSEYIKRKIRQIASRALILIRSYNVTKTVGQQQMASHFLLSDIKFTNHPLMQEIIAEVRFDIDAQNVKKELLKLTSISIQSHVKTPSPFAVGIVVNAFSEALKKSDLQLYKKALYEMVTVLVEKPSEIKNVKEFNYTTYWKEQPPKPLIEQVREIAHYIKLDPTIQYELVRLFEGETTGFSAQFQIWLRELIQGTVPKIWTDEMVQFMKKALENFQYK